jgi:hypothetical protein
MSFIEVTLEDGSKEFRHVDYDKLVVDAEVRDAAAQPLNILTPQDVDEYESTQYQRDRAREYPPITDYIDGVVKGDQAQIDAYIAACQAVKAKYPKPE